MLNPYEDLTGGQWLRGNLHTHSTQSDGKCAPQEVIDDYARRGYGFLKLSDHDALTSEAMYKQWNDRGMVLIPGYEHSGSSHLLHVDADRLLPHCPQIQDVLNGIVVANKESGHGFAIIAHPNWQAKFDHASIAQLREWVGYDGIEIFNGVCAHLDGSPYATNKWDMLLSDGRRVWGFANDDSHSPQGVELGWNVAYVKDKSPAGVIDALRKGRFYASSGVVIKSISVDGMKIRIETENARRIGAIRDVGRRFATVDDRVMEVTVPNDAQYVRFECWGDGEKFAWTQPFFVAGPDGLQSLPHYAKKDGDKYAVLTWVYGAEPAYIRTWQATPIVEKATVSDASPEQAAKLSSETVECGAMGTLLDGFADVRKQIDKRGGVVYLTAKVNSDQPGRGILKLGYDGPIRVWLNGKEIFIGPGKNPAVRDQLSLYADFIKGTNTIVVALDSNGGKAWGIFARVE